MTAVTDLRAFHVARASYMNVRRAWGSLVHDRRLGIDTSREVRLSSLGLAEQDRVDYEPSGWSSARIALDRLTVEPDDVLIDLGSGKGRVVLEAAQRPFAGSSASSCRPSSRGSPEATSQRAGSGCAARTSARHRGRHLVRDAGRLTVVYLCNPFGGEVFTAALDAMIASVDRAPRRVRISYWIRGARPPHGIRTRPPRRNPPAAEADARMVRARWAARVRAAAGGGRTRCLNAPPTRRRSMPTGTSWPFVVGCRRSRSSRPRSQH